MQICNEPSGVHRRHQHKTGRIIDRHFGPADGHAAFFHRLPHYFEGGAFELGQFIQKQYAVVRQTDLSGHRVGAAAHQRHIADGVVRRPERPGGHQRRIAGQNAGDRVYLGGIQCFMQGEWRQDGGQATGQHGFAGARRADQDHIVAAGCGEFEGAFDIFLSAHIAEIHVVVVEVGGKFVAGIHIHRLDIAFTGDDSERIIQVFHAIHIEFVDDGGFFGIHFRENEALEFLSPGFDGNRQCTFDGSQRAVEGKFAHDEKLVEAGDGDQVGSGQDTDSDGQVVSGAFFPNVGGGEVDNGFQAGDMPARVFEGGFYPGVSFAHGAVGESDDVEGWFFGLLGGNGAAGVYFDGDGAGIHAVDGAGKCFYEHKD